MKTIKLTGTDLQHAIAHYVRQNADLLLPDEVDPVVAAVTITGPFQVMVILSTRTPVVTVEVEIGPAPETRASSPSEGDPR